MQHPATRGLIPRWWPVPFALLLAWQLQPAVAAHAEHTVNVQVISASMAPGNAEPELASLHLSAGPFAFASYHLVHEELVTLHAAEPSLVPLEAGYSLAITLRGQDATGRLRLHLRVNGDAPGHPIDAEYELRPKGDLLVGGMKAGAETIFIRIRGT